jgi:hypothetical protein
METVALAIPAQKHRRLCPMMPDTGFPGAGAPPDSGWLGGRALTHHAHAAQFADLTSRLDDMTLANSTPTCTVHRPARRRDPGPGAAHLPVSWQTIVIKYGGNDDRSRVKRRTKNAQRHRQLLTK